MKEHARRASTKPLTAEGPGENGVGDLMFIEGRSDLKTPFYVHVDVATKLVMGYPMKDKTYGEMVWTTGTQAGTFDVRPRIVNCRGTRGH